MAARKLGPVVEGDGAAALDIEFAQPLLEFAMHMVGVFRLNLHDDRVTRLAVNERGPAASARRPKHGVSLKVAQPQPLLDHFRPLVDPRDAAGFGLFSAITPL